MDTDGAVGNELKKGLGWWFHRDMRAGIRLDITPKWNDMQIGRISGSAAA